MKKRADELLVQQGLCETRNQAKTLISKGKVRVNDQIVDKPSREFDLNTPFIVDELPKFVSRGGEKLEAFLLQYPINLNGAIGLDVGASTGGFTDCLLKHDIRHVVCVDVGHGQLHPKLQMDPRVTNLEKINARSLTADQLPFKQFNIIVMDVSFISITKILPALWPLLLPKGHLITLIKPQFEAEKSEVDAAEGIIKNPTIHQRIVESIQEFCLTQLPHSALIGLIDSPITGSDGNKEFLLGLTKEK